VQRQVRSLPVQPGSAIVIHIAVCAAEKHHGRRIGQDEQVTELPVGYWAGRAAIQAHDPGADGPGCERKREDRPGA